MTHRTVYGTDVTKPTGGTDDFTKTSRWFIDSSENSRRDLRAKTFNTFTEFEWLTNILLLRLTQPLRDWCNEVPMTSRKHHDHSSAVREIVGEI